MVYNQREKENKHKLANAQLFINNTNFQAPEYCFRNSQSLK